MGESGCMEGGHGGGRGTGEVEEPNSESYRLTRRKKTTVRTSCKPREKGQIRMAITRKPTCPNQPITSFHSHACGESHILL